MHDNPDVTLRIQGPYPDGEAVRAFRETMESTGAAVETFQEQAPTDIPRPFEPKGSGIRVHIGRGYLESLLGDPEETEVRRVRQAVEELMQQLPAQGEGEGAQRLSCVSVTWVHRRMATFFLPGPERAVFPRAVRELFQLLQSSFADPQNAGPGLGQNAPAGAKHILLEYREPEEGWRPLEPMRSAARQKPEG